MLRIWILGKHWTNIYPFVVRLCVLHTVKWTNITINFQIGSPTIDKYLKVERML